MLYRVNAVFKRDTHTLRALNVRRDLEAETVRRGEEMLEVGACAELGIDLAIVNDRVVTAKGALAGEFADGLAWHDPDDVDAIVAEFGQHGFGSGKGALGGELPRVEFVDSGIVRPVGVTVLAAWLRLGCAGRECQQTKSKN